MLPVRYYLLPLLLCVLYFVSPIRTRRAGQLPITIFYSFLNVPLLLSQTTEIIDPLCLRCLFHRSRHKSCPIVGVAHLRHVVVGL